MVMGFFDKLFGRDDSTQQPAGRGTWADRPRPLNGQTARQPSDEQALARYQYMLRTAPPDAIEQAHEEAFAQLTPEQRRMAHGATGTHGHAR
jgi:hypothetical protein